jgi:flagellar basal-body rod protein FlgB
MTIQDIGLFQGLSAKMDYLNQRQSILSQNVANADTPGYRPKDLEKVDFGAMMKNLTGDESVKVAVTDEMHMPNPKAEIDPRSKKQKHTYEVAPAGNAVVMEEQLFQSSKNGMDYGLMLNIYQKQVGMLRTALGTGR